MLEFAADNLFWFYIGACGLVGTVIGHIIGRVGRAFALRDRTKAALILVSVLSMGVGAFISLEKFIEPYFREECCRARAAAWVTKSPAYATLAEHHPDAKEALVKAMTKIGMGGSDAIVGHAEFSAVLNHYLRLYLPVTSDSAAREFAMAATALVDEALKTEPELCVNFMNGRSQNLGQKLPAHIMSRYGNAVGRVITDGIKNRRLRPTQPQSDGNASKSLNA